MTREFTTATEISVEGVWGISGVRWLAIAPKTMASPMPPKCGYMNQLCGAADATDEGL